MQDEHVETGEDLLTGQRLQAHVARIRPFADASSDLVEELKMIARINEKGELRMADVIDIGRLDDGTHNVSVAWKRLDAEFHRNLL